MGKDNLILGTGRGKLGDIVFYRTGGEQRYRTRVRPTNPRTDAQLIQRCVVSTAVKYYSEIATIADHSFQNYEGALKNHQRFMRLNIKALREVALQNVYSWSPMRWRNNNYGNYVWKDSSAVAINPYIISEGDIIAPAILRKSIAGESAGVQIGDAMAGAFTDVTYQNMAFALGAVPGDQITAVISHCVDGLVDRTYIGRLILVPSDGDSSAQFVNSDNTGINMPNKENYGDVQFKLAAVDGGYALTVGVSGVKIAECAVGIIISRRQGERWKRSTSVLNVPTSQVNKQSLQIAVDSYRMAQTSSLYLNQGDNYGEESEMNQGTGGNQGGTGGNPGLEMRINPLTGLTFDGQQPTNEDDDDDEYIEQPKKQKRNR